MIEIDFSEPCTQKFVDIVQYGDGDMIDDETIGRVDVTGVDPEDYALQEESDLYYFLVSKFDTVSWRKLVDGILDATDYYEVYRNIGISNNIREALDIGHTGAVIINAVGDNIETGETEDFPIAYFALMYS